MEEIDEQVDRILDLKQHIDFLKRDILTTRKRQLSFLTELFDLYQSKDREIDYLQVNLTMAERERDQVSVRRDEAFSTLVELLGERRLVLRMVEEKAEIVGMRYITSRA